MSNTPDLEMSNENAKRSAPETTSSPAPLTREDIAQIIEGIEEFIVSGDPNVAEIWQPYVDKLKALAAQKTNENADRPSLETLVISQVNPPYVVSGRPEAIGYLRSQLDHRRRLFNRETAALSGGALTTCMICGQVTLAGVPTCGRDACDRAAHEEVGAGVHTVKHAIDLLRWWADDLGDDPDVLEHIKQSLECAQELEDGLPTPDATGGQFVV